MASIVVVAGPNSGDYYPLSQGTTTIGRHEGCTVQIVDDSVSRSHMRIRYDAETTEYVAIDLESRHGVYVGAARIQNERPLQDGDLIGIGDTRIMFFTREFPDRESALKDARLRRSLGEEDRRTFM